MSDGNVTPLPRRPLPKDEVEGLKQLVGEYAAASNRDRNYRSNHFAFMFWAYLTDLMPVIEQRRADRRAQAEAKIGRLMEAPSRPRLRVVDGGKS